MAELADGRVYKRKRIKDPNDDNNYIDIPVIYQANFKTMQEQAQESILYFNNSSTSSRKIHIQRVTNPDDGSYVNVERIDEWYSKMMQEQAQEYAHVMKNTDPPPMQPDGSNNPAHEQTHIVRYYRNNAAGTDKPWVDVELIDCLKIVDVASQYQEWLWYPKHPELDNAIDSPGVPYPVTLGYCDPLLDLAPLEPDLDPPYRLDPLQNIINCKWSSEESTGGIWYFWMVGWWTGAPTEMAWRWDWLQMNGTAPHYPYPVEYPWRQDYGFIGNVPHEHFYVEGGLDPTAMAHYHDRLIEILLDSTAQTVLVAFIIGEDWTA